jgi:dienelactone hydrolase
MDPMAEYTKRNFSSAIADGSLVDHDIYERGNGPPIIIMQELPGIGQETLHLADRLIESGLQVVIPHMFGPLGKVSMAGNFGRLFCMRRQFHLFERNASSPIIDWLRALCRDVRDSSGTAGVGVIGMCLTGNFAISLMAEDSVLAGVASQPAMPIFVAHKTLHMTNGEADRARDALTEKGPMLAYRFEGDPLCTATKFKAIDERFNEPEKERVKLGTLPGKGHSVLTLDFVDEKGHPTHEALEEIMTYFNDKLSGPDQPATS